MPLQEAPANFDDESSPENSILAELGAGIAVPVTAPQPQLALDRGNNNFGAFRMPTIRLPPRTVGEIQQEVTLHSVESRNRRANTLTTFEAEIQEAESWLRVGLTPQPPPVVNLLPVTLPPQSAEPQLDELLRRVTQRSDLHNVETVRLRVISAITVSLSRLAMFLPRLQHLDLSGSVLCSLRDLGSGLLHLAHLNVSNCGLNSFDGTSGMPSLRDLVADGNMIQRVDPLAELPLLERLSARNNRISDLGLLTFLAMCPNLTQVSLQGNPVCFEPLYRDTLQRNVSTLRLIDGTSLEDENLSGISPTISSHSRANVQQQLAPERAVALNKNLHRQTSTTSTASTQSSRSLSPPNTVSENETLSSLSSEHQLLLAHMPTLPTSDMPLSSSSSSSKSYSSATSPQGAYGASSYLSTPLTSFPAVRHLRRPATAPLPPINTTPAHGIDRPASAQLHQSVRAPGSASSLIVGSVLDLVRQRRRRRYEQPSRNAWIPDNNGSTSSETSSVASSHFSTPVTEF